MYCAAPNVSELSPYIFLERKFYNYNTNFTIILKMHDLDQPFLSYQNLHCNGHESKPAMCILAIFEQGQKTISCFAIYSLYDKHNMV